VAIAGIGVATHHGKHASARAAIAAPKRHLTVLAPTPPTPCYLLIADRGNGRMLLVDSACSRPDRLQPVAGRMAAR
jgi:hypothetical protein